MLGLQGVKYYPEQHDEHIECLLGLIATKVSKGEFVKCYIVA